jgi:ketosteroid isomerase-like protein
MSRNDWCQMIFARIDAKDTPGFLEYLAPDAQFRFGSTPAVNGHADIGAAVEGFFASLDSLTHRVLEVWETGGWVICRGEVTYVRRDARTVRVPFCDLLQMRGRKIARYEIYLDPTPLTAS